MTLKEKLEIIKGYDEQDPYATFMTIADDYAIEFGKWYEFTLRESDNLNERFTSKELIEMFKKEKGL